MMSLVVEYILSELSVNPTRVKILELTSQRQLSSSAILSELKKTGYAGNKNTLYTHIEWMSDSGLVRKTDGSIAVTGSGIEVLKKYRERTRKDS